MQKHILASLVTGALIGAAGCYDLFSDPEILHDGRLDETTGTGGSGGAGTGVTTTVTSTTAAPSCGDGNLDSGEECDDGNSQDSDGCNADCRPSGRLLWSTTVDMAPGGYYESPRGVAVLADGRFAVVGCADQDGPGGTKDIAVAVVDATGMVAWSQTIDGSGKAENGGGQSDWGSAVAALPGGDFVVAGYEFVDDPAIVSYADEYPWLRRFTGTGAAVWTKQAPLVSRGRASAIAVGPEGNVYAAFYIGTSSGGGWLTAYHESGAELWSQELSGKTPYDLTVHTQGRLFTVGRSSDDSWLAAVEPSGSVAWEKVKDHGGSDYLFDADVDGTGSLLVLGVKDGTTAAYGYLAEKYTPDGELIWHLEDFTPPGRQINALAAAPDGGFVLVGRAPSNSPTEDWGDIWLGRYTADAKLLWQRSVSGKGKNGEVGYAAAFTPNGDVVVAGDTSDSIAKQGDFWVGLWSP